MVNGKTRIQKKDSMKLLTIKVPDDIHEALRKKSYLQHRSMASIVREAVGEYLEKLDKEEGNGTLTKMR